MSYSISPMGDSENWMQIVRRMRENGVPEGGYPDTTAGIRKMDAARELAAKQLKQESNDRKLRREARAKKKPAK